VKLRILTMLACMAMVLTFAPAVAAEGLCSGSSIGQLYVARYFNGTDRYDHVSGSATAQDLDNCSRIQDGVESTILPANIQTSSGIYQLGVNDGGPGGHQFVYVFCPQCGGDNIIYTGVSPIIGHSYQYDIYLNNIGCCDMNVHYTVIDKTADPDITVVNRTAQTPYRNKGEIAWWGAERQTSTSGLGHSHGDGQTINMRIMKYSTTTISNDIQVTNIDAGDMHSVGVGSDQHWHASNDNYTNDQVDFDNTSS
jgi:hypothetical protein